MTRTLSLFALSLALAAPLGAAAAPAAPAGLEVRQAWSRPAAAGTNGVGYLVIQNHGKATETLVAVESPAAARVEMHSSSMAGGVMSMARLDRVAAPAGGSVTFGPGGDHLMLIKLNRALKVGDSVPATLVFADGRRVAARFKVSITPPAGEGAEGVQGMPGMGH